MENPFNLLFQAHGYNDIAHWMSKFNLHDTFIEENEMDVEEYILVFSVSNEKEYDRLSNLNHKAAFGDGFPLAETVEWHIYCDYATKESQLPALSFDEMCYRFADILQKKYKINDDLPSFARPEMYAMAFVKSCFLTSSPPGFRKGLPFARSITMPMSVWTTV